jgi:hypothetical protein
MQPITVEIVSGKMGKGSLVLVPLPLQEFEFPFTFLAPGSPGLQSNIPSVAELKHAEGAEHPLSLGQDQAVGMDERWWKDLIAEDTDLQLPALHALFGIALEIAREGREGRKVGTAFLIGDTQTVLAHSCQMILNPFQGYPPKERSLTRSDLKETIKELAQLDGALVITGDGVVEAAARRITVDTSQIIIPSGYGTRHCSIAAITLISRAIGMVVSQSGVRISIMKEGRILRVIHPR